MNKPRQSKSRIVGKVELPAPWESPELDKEDVIAIQAMMRGEANADHQRRVINWLITSTGMHNPTFRPGPDGQRATDFAEGKRFIGIQFFTLAKISLASTAR